MARNYTTQQAADAIGVAKSTLLRWLCTGRLPEPRRVGFSGLSYRVWTGRDVAAARRHKRRFYRKGRGRKRRGS